MSDLAASEDYAVTKVTYYDCVLSHNGLGLVGRICDCMGDDDEPAEKWCFWPACSCGRDKCEPWLDEVPFKPINKVCEATNTMCFKPYCSCEKTEIMHNG